RFRRCVGCEQKAARLACACARDCRRGCTGVSAGRGQTTSRFAFRQTRELTAGIRWIRTRKAACDAERRSAAQFENGGLFFLCAGRGLLAGEEEDGGERNQGAREEHALLGL